MEILLSFISGYYFNEIMDFYAYKLSITLKYKTLLKNTNNNNSIDKQGRNSLLLFLLRTPKAETCNRLHFT